MTDHKAPPIKGYQDIPNFKLKMVNDLKESEEIMLRRLDMLDNPPAGMTIDPRWVAIARTHIQQGYMAMIRAILQPQRINLHGDPADDATR